MKKVTITDKSEAYIARIKKIRHMASRHDDYVIERALKYYLGIKEHEDTFLARRKQYKRLFFKLQDGRCFYCYRVLDYKEGTLDHKTPRSRGGSSQLTNIQLVCNECNVRKGDMTHEEFVEFIANKGDIIHLRRQKNLERQLLDGKLEYGGALLPEATKTPGTQATAVAPQ